jgi:hypothetical protein
MIFPQDEQLALFEIKGDHTGYEDRLDLPTDFTFQGARVPLPALLQAAVKGALSAINLLAIPLAEKVLLVSQGIARGKGSGGVEINIMQPHTSNRCCSHLTVHSTQNGGHAGRGGQEAKGGDSTGAATDH